MSTNKLKQLCAALRHDILTCSTEAGSGHPTSSLSAVELMATLFFDGHLQYDLDHPDNIYNDRIIFSKGHASPLFYSLYHRAGAITYDELMTFRKFTSNLEGHPTLRFKYTEAATGSLGQGLSVGLGIALGMRLRLQPSSRARNERGDLVNKELAPACRQAGRHYIPRNDEHIPHVYVLLGDSEIAEGQVWEAMELATHYKVNNLIAILDVNRLGQRGETMLGWDTKTYKKRAEAFGWNTIVINDGHDLAEIKKAFDSAVLAHPRVGHRPTMLIAKTVKGKGVSFLEDKDNWHGKTLTKDQLADALKELGEIDKDIKGQIARSIIVRDDLRVVPHQGEHMGSPLQTSHVSRSTLHVPLYDSPTATREAYGDFLVRAGEQNDPIIVLDAEVSNSTYANKFAEKFPDRYFEMYIAEQNMASVAVGLSRMGFTPFISTFAAFLTRAYDQIRMAQYSEANVKVVGSHAGVSIGTDGSSQMGLEDLSMMKSIRESTVLYPSDSVSTIKLAQLLMECHGIGYLRLTREKTPILYTHQDQFVIGGSQVLKSSVSDKAVIIAAGITLHEALKAYDELQKIGINVGIIDAYSIKPIDKKTIVNHATKAGSIVVVEDHYVCGGLGDSVFAALAGTPTKVIHLAVNKTPHSGKPEELLAYEEIDAAAIVKAVRSL